MAGSKQPEENKGKVLSNLQMSCIIFKLMMEDIYGNSGKITGV